MMKMRLRNSCQYFGIVMVKMFFVLLINLVLSIGLIRVLCLLSVIQMVVLMELVGDILLGLMIFICGIYNVFVRLQSIVDSVYISSLKLCGLYLQNISWFLVLCIVVRIWLNLFCVSVVFSYSVSNSSKIVVINRLVWVLVVVIGKFSSVVKLVKLLLLLNLVLL